MLHPEQYFTADKEKRSCTSMGVCDPFRFEELPDIETKIYHFTGLVYGDFDGPLFTEASRHGKVAADVQCLLRHVEPDKTMAFHDWAEKRSLPCIDYLKTDAAEAAKTLHNWGAKEVLSAHNTEVLVYDEERGYTCPIKGPEPLRPHTPPSPGTSLSANGRAWRKPSSTARPWCP